MSNKTLDKAIDELGNLVIQLGTVLNVIKDQTAPAEPETRAWKIYRHTTERGVYFGGEWEFIGTVARPADWNFDKVKEEEEKFYPRGTRLFVSE